MQVVAVGPKFGVADARGRRSTKSNGYGSCYTFFPKPQCLDHSRLRKTRLRLRQTSLKACMSRSPGATKDSCDPELSNIRKSLRSPVHM